MNCVIQFDKVKIFGDMHILHKDWNFQPLPNHVTP
jgi:hypothetical protein